MIKRLLSPIILPEENLLSPRMLSNLSSTAFVNKPFVVLRVFLLISIFCFSLFGCTRSDTIEQHREFIAQNVINNSEIQSEFIEFDQFKLHFKYRGTAEKAVVLWIHGTPGSWDDIGELFIDKDFLSNVMLVSVDRPGWGLSQYIENPRIMPEFNEQSKYIGVLLSKLKSESPGVPLIVVGHSWGASLTPYLLLEHSENIDAAILLAGGLNPDLVKPRWYNKAASTWLVKSFLGEKLQFANDEIYQLRPELKSIVNRWGEIDKPIIVVQGADDGLVDPLNAEYAREKLNPENTHILILQEQGHLLQMERTVLIARCVMAAAAKDMQACKE